MLQAEDEEKERKDEGERAREEEHEDDGGGVGPIEDLEPLILEDSDPVGEEEEESITPEEFAKLQKEQEEEWRAVAEGLQEPVKLHNLLFTEPLVSKRSAEVLRAVQRIHARISLLNLAVRRVHSDGGREFANAAFRGWCASRDIHPTYSPPSDPKANGRIEGTVGQVKAGIRALLRAQPQLGREHWPSALRQYTAQRFWMSMQTLGGPGPKRKLPPFGASVVVQSRNWSRKTPYAPRAVRGEVLCPAANISGCTVVKLPPLPNQTGPRFHVAPIVYEGVKDPPGFEARAEPSVFRPRRRVVGKQPIEARVSGNTGGSPGRVKKKRICLVPRLTVRTFLVLGLWLRLLSRQVAPLMLLMRVCVLREIQLMLMRLWTQTVWTPTLKAWSKTCLGKERTRERRERVLQPSLTCGLKRLHVTSVSRQSKCVAQLQVAVCAD